MSYDSNLYNDRIREIPDPKRGRPSKKYPLVNKKGKVIEFGADVVPSRYGAGGTMATTIFNNVAQIEEMSPADRQKAKNTRYFLDGWRNLTASEWTRYKKDRPPLIEVSVSGVSSDFENQLAAKQDEINRLKKLVKNATKDTKDAKPAIIEQEEVI